MKKWGIILFIICLAVGLAGCAVRDTSPESSHEPASVEQPPLVDSSLAEAAPPPVEEAASGQSPLDPTAEWYYDYLLQNSHIGLLIPQEGQAPGFSDDQMGAYAIAQLIVEDRYDFDLGSPREEFDAVVFQYFGRTLGSYETPKITVHPESGNILSTGWGGTAIHMVLHTLEELDDGGQSATFYQFSAGMGEDLPPQQQMKAELLRGELERYSPIWLIRLDLEERTDEDGRDYLFLREMENLGVTAGPFSPYGA